MAAQLQQSQAASTAGVHEIEAEDTFQVRKEFLPIQLYLFLPGHRASAKPWDQCCRHQEAEGCWNLHGEGHSDGDQEEVVQHQGVVPGQGGQDEGGGDQGLWS